MGSTQSSHAATNDKVTTIFSSSVRGRKSSFMKGVPHGLRASVVSMPSDQFNASYGYDDADITYTETYHEDEDANEVGISSCEEGEIDTESEYESDEDEEFWEERLRIIEEARQLKQSVEFFRHPEAPVPSSIQARCFFDRPSATEQLSKENAEELAAILEDASTLKKYAGAYAHPEQELLTTDSLSKARNFYGRASALEQDALDIVEERELVLNELKALKQAAIHFNHPEFTVTSSYCGRNFFTRPSAIISESLEETENRRNAISDLPQLKASASNFLHPERPVQVDATCFGRNYFSRFTAPIVEMVEERELILSEAAALGIQARNFSHPEMCLDVAPCAQGRNYFTRASAPEYEVEDDVATRSEILNDAKILKENSVMFMHPELPVKISDPSVCGRNFFTRPSAAEYETSDDPNSRSAVLKDAMSIKQSVVEYLHPEMPIESSDSTIFGRNYFSRASGSAYETEQDADIRAQVLADAKAFKILALDFLHPEIPVVSDIVSRSYFSRPSAPSYESLEDAEARAQVMADLKTFKELAFNFFHPERSVVKTDPLLFGRNFFERVSAETTEDYETQERALILAEMKLLKDNAIHFMHPELPVCTNDSTIFGRNYFERPSAPECETKSHADERDAVFSDLKFLKESADHFCNPDKPVTMSDPYATGRNFFNRPSASISEELECSEEYDRIIKDIKALKEVAHDFLHPELPVKSMDPTLSGRNYFNRASAPTQESILEAMDRLVIMSDIKLLKTSAIEFLHPEKPLEVVDSISLARCYFTRPSAAAQEDEAACEEHALIMADIIALKEAAKSFMHPELPVVTSDPLATGRNYFDRASNDLHFQMIHTFPAHEDDCTTHHDEHMDHFGMDEEMEGMFTSVQHNFGHSAIGYGNDNFYNKIDEEDGGGNLSRSPSSVMLFSGEDP